MKVVDWLDQHPGADVAVDPDCPLETILKKMLDKPRVRDLYVVDGNGYVLGRLSYMFLARQLLGEHHPAHSSSRQIMERLDQGCARDLMTTHFSRAHPDDSLDDTLARQVEHGVHDMPVVDDDGRLVGAINLDRALEETRKTLAGKAG
jgi:CBS domain-containing membrane protein